MNIQGINKASNIQRVGHLKNSQNVTDLSDKINISEQAHYMDKLSEVPAVRQEKIDAIKAKISNGTYLKEANLEKAMDNMLKDLI